MDGSNQIYAFQLGHLARELMADTPVLLQRLEYLRERISIDEVQDVSGYNWEIVHDLLESRIDDSMVGDVRHLCFRPNRKGRTNSMGTMVRWIGSLYEKREGC